MTINKKIIFFTGYVTLIIGFLLNENSSGGAYPDFKVHLSALIGFEDNFKDSFLNYSKFNTDHSPLFIIFLKLINNILGDYNLMRFFYMSFFSMIIIIFYLCLKLKFSKTDDLKLFLISSILFISPNFRSLLIWPGSEIISIFFFIISVYFFIKFEKDKKFKFVINNIIFLSLAAYMRPVYSIFSIYFFICYFLEYSFSKKIMIIILLNIFLSIPAFYYIFFIDNFMSLYISSKSLGEFSNKILIISSILCFHFFPFIFYIFKKKLINFNYKIQIIFILFLSFLIKYFNFNVYQIGYGGGFFLKLSNLILGNNLIFYFFSIIFLSLFTSIKSKNFIKNYLLLFLLFALIPHSYYYHEYYDPLLLVLLFTLFDIKIDKSYFNDHKNIFILFIFNIIFYLLNLIKNLNLFQNNIIS